MCDATPEGGGRWRRHDGTEVHPCGYIFRGGASLYGAALLLYPDTCAREGLQVRAGVRCRHLRHRASRDGLHVEPLPQRGKAARTATRGGEPLVPLLAGGSARAFHLGEQLADEADDICLKLLVLSTAEEGRDPHRSDGVWLGEVALLMTSQGVIQNREHQELRANGPWPTR